MAEAAEAATTRSGTGRYDSAAIAFHWLTALLVVTQFGLAQLWGFASHDTRQVMQQTHVSLGLTLATILVLRLVWRAGFSRRPPPATTGLLKWAGEAMHATLYVLLVVIVLAGLGKVWAYGDELGFFGLFALPQPFELDRAWRPVVNAVHLWGAWAIIVLATLHAAAALTHHYILKDGVLRHMLPGARRDPRSWSGDSGRTM